jgi:hypothetical protein
MSVRVVIVSSGKSGGRHRTQYALDVPSGLVAVATTAAFVCKESETLRLPLEADPVGSTIPTTAPGLAVIETAIAFASVAHRT